MKQKSGFTLRNVCGEHVIVAEGLEVINFNKLLSLNESAAYLWEQAAQLGDFTAEQLAAVEVPTPVTRSLNMWARQASVRQLPSLAPTTAN